MLSHTPSDSAETRVYRKLEDGIQGEVKNICKRLKLEQSSSTIIGYQPSPQVLESMLSQVVRKGVRECLSEFSSGTGSLRKEKEKTEATDVNSGSQDDSVPGRFCEPRHFVSRSLELTKKKSILFERSYKVFFGKVTIRSYSEISMDSAATIFGNNSTSLLDLSFSILPNPRFFSTAPILSVSAYRKSHGSKIYSTLIYFNVVPSESEVFKAVEDGDLVHLQELLRTGQASLFDVDEDGRNLIHVRVRSAVNEVATLTSRLSKAGSKQGSS